MLKKTIRLTLLGMLGLFFYAAPQHITKATIFPMSVIWGSCTDSALNEEALGIISVIGSNNESMTFSDQHFHGGVLDFFCDGGEPRFHFNVCEGNTNCLEDPPSLNILTPTGTDDPVVAGTPLEITWSQEHVETVNIGYKSCETCFEWIIQDLAIDTNNSLHSYIWNIPQNIPGGSYRITMFGSHPERGITQQTSGAFDISPTLSENNPQLSVQTGSTIYSEILHATQDNAEILKLRLNALNEDIFVSDLYLKNILHDPIRDFGNRAAFKLYSENNQPMSESQMIDGNLYFNLNNNQITIPQDDSTIVTIKADIRDITNANQTGARLQLSLDTEGTINEYKGVRAPTTISGELTTPPDGWGEATSEEFIVYKTEFFIQHDFIQPATIDFNEYEYPVYRFRVDSHYVSTVDLGRITIDINLTNIQRQEGLSFSAEDIALRLSESQKSGLQIPEVANISIENVTGSSARVHFDFLDQVLFPGEYKSFEIALRNIEPINTETDSLISVQIIGDPNPAEPSTREGKTNENQNIIWSDESASAHADTTFDWLNGYLLPIDTYTQVNPFTINTVPTYDFEVRNIDYNATSRSINLCLGYTGDDADTLLGRSYEVALDIPNTNINRTYTEPFYEEHFQDENCSWWEWGIFGLEETENAEFLNIAENGSIAYNIELNIDGESVFRTNGTTIIDFTTPLPPYTFFINNENQVPIWYDDVVNITNINHIEVPENYELRLFTLIEGAAPVSFYNLRYSNEDNLFEETQELDGEGINLVGAGFGPYVLEGIQTWIFKAQACNEDACSNWSTPLYITTTPFTGEIAPPVISIEANSAVELNSEFYEVTTNDPFLIKLENINNIPNATFRIEYANKIDEEGTSGNFGPYTSSVIETWTFWAQTCVEENCSEWSNPFYVNVVSPVELTPWSGSEGSGDRSLYDILIVSDLSEPDLFAFLEESFGDGPFSLFSTAPLQGQRNKFNIYYYSIPTINYQNTNDCRITRVTSEALREEAEIFNPIFNQHPWADVKISLSVNNYVWPHALLPFYNDDQQYLGPPLPSAADGKVFLERGSINLGMGCSVMLQDPTFPAKIMAHEIGHGILNLNDEYTAYERLSNAYGYYGGDRNCSSFVAPPSRWNNIPNYNGYLEDECFTESYCEGIVCTNTEKNISNSIMNYQYSFTEGTWPTAWGPVNTYYIQDFLEDIDTDVYNR